MTPHDKLYDLRNIIRAKRDTAKSKYEAFMAEEFREIELEHKEEIQSLEKQCREIEYQRELERIAKASTETLGGVPVGGKVVEWKPKYRFSTEYVPTGVTGIVEICAHDSKFGNNVDSYSQPPIGKLFVRVLKKDGTPSLKFVGGYTLDGNLPYNWHPEGVDPNVEKNKK